MAPEADFNVGYVANLCRLELTEEETQRYQQQLDKVLNFMRQIDKLDVSGIEPTAHANPVYDVLREDIARPSLSQEDALSNAPQSAQGQFSVTKVIE